MVVVSYLVHMLIAIGSKSSKATTPEYTLTYVNAYVSQILFTKKRRNQPIELVFRQCFLRLHDGGKVQQRIKGEGPWGLDSPY